jgi:hypothetical protein
MAEMRTPELRNERIESLRTLPRHREVSPKFNAETMLRTLMPLTQEDKNQSQNLPLITTLRQPLLDQKYTKDTNGQPPSFYEDDLKKWEEKFARSVSDRQEFKKRFMSSRKLTCLTRNDNTVEDWDFKL